MTTAIITGASRGLGLALAEQLAAAGWNLIIDGRDAEALRSAAVSLPGVVRPIAGDITDPAHRAALVDAADGRLDLLINNAGTLGPSPLPSVADFGLDELRNAFEVNTLAPLALTQLALPLLRASGGTVIDVTSDAAVEAYSGWGGYGASKAATEQLRNVLAAEEPEVTVWRVDPGDLRTRMHQDAFPGEDISDRPLPSEVAPALLRLLAASPPSGRHRLSDYAAFSSLAGPVRLWWTSIADDYPGVRSFYRDALGLAEVDGWESGTVFAVGDGRIEIAQGTGVEPREPTTGVMPTRTASDPATSVVPALEYRDGVALATVWAALGSPGVIEKHPRGHSGFTVTDPAGAELYLWTES